MRHERYRVEAQAAVEMFRRAHVVHLAAIGLDGQPILRTLHGVVVGDGVVWHGSPKGEKSSVGGLAGVVSCSSIVATIPSYFIDPERACPATTYYESAQASGIIEALSDPAEKAEALAELMRRFQPEGGHVPITADDPLYANAVKNLALWRMPLDRVVGKVKLGQNRQPDERRAVLEGMWRRGDPGDVRAIATLLRATPSIPTPSFLEAPEGVELVVDASAADVEGAVTLLSGLYWNEGISDDVLRRAQTGSTAWVGARDLSGRLIATARAVTDGAKNGWIYDVAVAHEWRGRGVGRALMRLLMDHPRVRSVRRIMLSTLDGQDFYRRLGFDVQTTAGPTPGTEIMVRARSA